MERLRGLTALAGALTALDSDSHFDGHGKLDAVAHRRHAFRDQRGFRHQASAKRTGLHAIAGATDIEVDLVVALLSAPFRRARQRRRLTATQLQCDRVFRSVKREQSRPVAMNKRGRRDHLGVQQRVW